MDLFRVRETIQSHSLRDEHDKITRHTEHRDNGEVSTEPIQFFETLLHEVHEW
jgi:hypothetical protein